jgi:hypothetical protein
MCSHKSKTSNEMAPKLSITVDCGNGVSVEKPILSERDKEKRAERARGYAEAADRKQQQALLRAAKAKAVLEERERKAEEAHSTKIAKILTRASEIVQMRKEILVEVALVTRDVWDDKYDHLRKRLKFDRKPDVPRGSLPAYDGACGACRTQTEVAEIQLFFTKDGTLVCMCHACRGFDEENVAFEQGLRELREQLTLLLASVAAEHSTRSPLIEQHLVKLGEVRRILESKPGGDDVVEEGETIEMREWDIFTGGLPDYDQLIILDSLTGVLPDLQAKYQRVQRCYMQVFQIYYLDGLIRMSVNYRNYDIRSRYRGFEPPLLDVETASKQWIEQEGRCSNCKEEMFWWGLGHGIFNRPQLDRVDVGTGTYVQNFVWLCRFCNSKKGRVVEMRRYDELLLETLQSAHVALSRGEDMKDVEARLKVEVDRQCSRAKYRSLTRCDKNI